MKRPKIGDVVEFDTGKGLAYAHYTHRDQMWGYLLRVYNRLYSERPADLAAALKDEPTFYTFFPLGSFVQRGAVTIVGNVALSERSKIRPLFRSGNRDRRGKIHEWWISDGGPSRRVGPLTDEIRKLSPLGLCDDAFLIDQIVSGWTPETDPTLEP